MILPPPVQNVIFSVLIAHRTCSIDSWPNQAASMIDEGKKSDRQFSNYFSGTSNSSSKELVVGFFFSCVMTTSTTKPQIRNYLNGKRLRERRNGGIHVNTKPGKRPKMNRKKCHSTMQLQKTGKKHEEKTTRNSKPFFSFRCIFIIGRFCCAPFFTFLVGFFLSLSLPFLTFQRYCWQIEWTTNITKQMTKRMLSDQGIRRKNDEENGQIHTHTRWKVVVMAANSKASASKVSHWTQKIKK